MPWKETCVIKERTKMMGEYLSGEYTLAELARRSGVSRKTVHKWVGRYERNPGQGLLDGSRAPHHHPNAVSPAMEAAILEWKARRPLWGAPKIHSKLKVYVDYPAESTVSNVLRRHGLTRRVRRRARATPSAGPLHHAQGPNEVWCVDFKGWFRTGDGQRCDPLTISDAFSRYLLCCQAVNGSTGRVVVQPLFEMIFREYGLPVAIRSDNGSPFASVGLGGLSQLSVWWLRLGVRLERIAPGHPEQNGRHERLHRTLKEAVLRPPEWDGRRQQAAFDGFREEYNQDRPHEALNQQPPASVYEPSRRDFPARLLEPEYPDDWLKRAVRSNGEIKWQGQKIYLSEALIGQWVGLEPAGEDRWAIHFMTEKLGYLEVRRGGAQVRRESEKTKTKSNLAGIVPPWGDDTRINQNP
jgi:putative transposase